MNLLSRLAASMPPALARTHGRRSLIAGLLAAVLIPGAAENVEAARRKATGKVQAAKKKRCKGRKCRRCPKGTVFIGGKGRRSVGWCASVALETHKESWSRVSGVAVSKDGTYFIADAGSNRIEHYAADGTLLKWTGGTGTPAGRFLNPVALALDDEVNVYVVDEGNSRIQRLSSSLTNPTVWATNVWAASGIVYQWPGIVYVACQGAFGVGIIRKYDKSGTSLTGSNENLGQPLALASGPDESGVIFPDKQNDVIRHMNANVQTIAQTAMSDVNDPQGIVSTRRGILVADTGSDRLVLYRTNGTPLSFGGPGTAVGKFDTPRGMALGPDGAVYVVDSGNHRVIRLTPAK